jgi:hypothetical protein
MPMREMPLEPTTIDEYRPAAVDRTLMPSVPVPFPAVKKPYMPLKITPSVKHRVALWAMPVFRTSMK